MTISDLECIAVLDSEKGTELYRDKRGNLYRKEAVYNNDGKSVEVTGNKYVKLVDGPVFFDPSKSSWNIIFISGIVGFYGGLNLWIVLVG